MIFDFIDMPKDKSPDFIAAYFQRLDDLGHEFGPSSTQVLTALTESDQVIRNITQGLQERNLLKDTDIMIVSDHGMSDVKKYVDLDQIVSNFTQRVFVHEFQSKSTKTSVVLNMKAINQNETTEIVRLLKSSPDMNCYLKHEIPERWNIKDSPRTGEIMCFMKIGSAAIVKSQNHWLPKGEHGYDIDEPEMKSIFIAFGPSFLNNKKIPEFNNVELYNVMCKLIGIKPSPNNGTSGFRSSILK